MHRSGTSAVARACNLLGVDLGNDFIPAHADNEAGYWEHAGVVDIHERLLKALDTRWHHTRPLPKDWETQDAVLALRAELTDLLRRDFGNAALWGIKDPRICRFLPLWWSVLTDLEAEPLVLLPFRHPAETVASLAKRDGLPRSAACHLWRRYVLDSEKGSQGQPRAFVDFGELMDDWRGTLARAWPQLGLDWSEPDADTAKAIDAFLKPRLRHHKADGDAGMSDEVRELHQALLIARKDSSDLVADAFAQCHQSLALAPLTKVINEDPDSELDFTPWDAVQAFEDRETLTREMDAAEVRYKALEGEYHKATDGIADLQDTVKDLNRQHEALAAKHEALDGEYQTALGAIEELRTDLHLTHERLNRTQQESAQFEHQAAHFEQLSLRYQQEAVRLQQDLDKIHRTVVWKLWTPLRWFTWVVLPVIVKSVREPSFLDFVVRRGRRAWMDGGARTFLAWIAGTYIPSEAEAPEEDKEEERKPNQPTDVYRAWVKAHGVIGEKEREALSRRAEDLTHKPVISVVMPVYEAPAEWLDAAIRSVAEQIYGNWELCIADDASPSAHVREILDTWQERDGRIKVVYRDENGHISAASNSALALATGPYVALIDHDDELSPDALLRMAEAINVHPETKLFYSDEDKLNENGERYDPHFKPDWNPDLFNCQNYVSHLSVYTRDIVERAGGFREGYEGSQDYDLTLRVVDLIEPAEIHHIPRVLYHWRAISGSTALDEGEKDFTADAARKALRDHFERTGTTAEVTEAFEDSTHHRIVYPLPDPEPMVSIIVPTRDKVDLLRGCIDSVLAKTEYTNYEIIVVDNESQEPETLAYFDSLADEPRVRILEYHEPFNFSAINNYTAARAKGSVLCLLNNDIVVIAPDWLREMVSHAVRPGIGCVGAKLYYGDDRIQHGGVILGLGGVAGHSHKYFPREHPGYFFRLRLVQNLSAVTAACLVLRREIFEEVEGLNEQDLTVAFNDVDFCIRVREAGYRNLWTPYAEMYHLESVSRGTDEAPKRRDRFAAEIRYMKDTWGDLLLQDPAYNLNLNLDREDFSIGLPSRVGD